MYFTDVFYGTMYFTETGTVPTPQLYGLQTMNRRSASSLYQCATSWLVLLYDINNNNNGFIKNITAVSIEL